MKRPLAALILAAALLLAGLNTHAYGSPQTLNAGVYVQLPASHHCGLEYRGTPGAFCDVS